MRFIFASVSRIVSMADDRWPLAGLNYTGQQPSVICNQEKKAVIFILNCLNFSY